MWERKVVISSSVRTDGGPDMVFLVMLWGSGVGKKGLYLFCSTLRRACSVTLHWSLVHMRPTALYRSTPKYSLILLERRMFSKGARVREMGLDGVSKHCRWREEKRLSLKWAPMSETRSHNRRHHLLTFVSLSSQRYTTSTGSS